MHHWTVGGALLEGPGGLLLVRNRRRNGSHDWTPPGGVIDEGETLLEGLTREVEEETGLRVTRWADGPVYEIEAVAEGLGWRLRVEAHLAIDYEGDLRLDDPDGIVVEARFVALDDCLGHLEAAQQWVWEPLGEWLRLRFAGPRRFDYQIVGTDAQALEITRV
jgi:8-oxo-dGTP diphosphatase